MPYGMSGRVFADLPARHARGNEFRGGELAIVSHIDICILFIKSQLCINIHMSVCCRSAFPCGPLCMVMVVSLYMHIVLIREKGVGLVENDRVVLDQAND